MCTITLSEFRGITSLGQPFIGPGTPPNIRVSGTITGCPPKQTGAPSTVTISTGCGGATGVPVTAAGAFTKDVANLEHCPCDSTRNVTITCDSDPSCFHTFSQLTLACGPVTPTPPPCPTGSPLSTNITYTESACSTLGERNVVATVSINTGWSVSKLEWSWDGGAAVQSMPLANTTSPAIALSGGAPHDLVVTAWLAAPNAHCHYNRFKTINVSTCACPPGTPFGPNINFNEGACSAGTRLVGATVTLDPAWNVARIEWSWDGAAPVPSSPPNNTTSPAIALTAGPMHSLVATAFLAAPDAHCSYVISRTLTVTACPPTMPTPCPTGSPFGPNITFTESNACDAAGQRDVQASVTLNPGWTVGAIEWSWDGGAAVPSNPPASTTSPPVALNGGATHDLVVTAILAAPDAHCRYVTSQRIPVSMCPPTTPTTPTPTTPTTPTPTTPTPTTPTTPSSSSLCGILLALALILLAAASVCLGIGGCLGPAGLPLTTTGISLSVTGLVVLALWIAFCRDCLLMRFLQRFFGAMALLMLIIMALLMLVGMAMCAMGALAIAALFGAMVGVLSIGISILGCP